MKIRASLCWEVKTSLQLLRELYKLGNGVGLWNARWGHREKLIQPLLANLRDGCTKTAWVILQACSRIFACFPVPPHLKLSWHLTNCLTLVKRAMDIQVGSHAKQKGCWLWATSPKKPLENVNFPNEFIRGQHFRKEQFPNRGEPGLTVCQTAWRVFHHC